MNIEQVPLLPFEAYEDDSFTGENPYWEVVKNLPHDALFSWGRQGIFSPESYPSIRRRPRAPSGLSTPDSWESDTEYLAPDEYLQRFQRQPNRTNLTRTYAFAIPTPASLRWLTNVIDGRPVVELGAGTGYWAWMLTQYGNDVTAFDAYPPDSADNHYFTPRDDETNEPTGEPGPIWFPVRSGREWVLRRRKYANHVLFLSWPNYGTSFGQDALRAFQGDTFIHIGEHGGCTADDGFFELLEIEWQHVDDCPNFVQWSGIHDYLEVYRRRTPDEVKAYLAAVLAGTE